jgi:AcrR family transcriptional regulator
MFSILNMRSASGATAGGSGDDRSTKARIRDAAIDTIAAHGISDTTVRKIAEAADVSPALVMHHFGSMEDLRRACDEHVAEVIRNRKTEAITSGPGIDVLQALREADYGSLTSYLARVLADDSDLVNRLVDDIAADAVEYMAEGVEAGMMRPTADPEGRAALPTLWSLGGLVLHHHMRRLLGIDLTDPDVAHDPDFIRYVRPALELIGSGMFTDEFNARLTDMFETGETP